MKNRYTVVCMLIIAIIMILMMLHTSCDQVTTKNIGESEVTILDSLVGSNVVDKELEMYNK